MKRVGFVIVMALIALMLIGCNNAAGTGSIDDLNAPAVLSKIPLRVCIDNMQTSRTIFPNAWNDETAGKLIFILTGETVVSGDEPSEELDLVDENLELEDQGKDNFTYEELTSGTLKVKISPLHWSLTLTAYEKDADGKADETKKVLKDTIEVDLTSNASSKVAAFKMRPVKEGTDSVGSIDLTLNFTKKDNLDRIEYGLYTDTALDDSVTALEGKKITAKATADEAAGVKAWNTVEGETDKCQINFTDSVKPDEYFFQARFYDSNNKLLAFYADNVYVDAANITEKEINLADIINTPPIAPTSFNVSYKFNDGTNQEIATGESVKDYYLATFTWEDNSNNELGFILDLTEEGGTPTKLTNVSEVADKATEGFGFLTSGNLKPSSTTCTVKLQTGKKYTATICAVNDFVAEEDYVTVACGDGTINMFTVTYDLNSGYVQKSATEKTSTETSTRIVKYAIAYEDKTEDQNLLSGSTGATYPSVRYDGNGFEYWLNTTTSPSARINEIPANNTSNIDVEAVWTNSLTVQMTLPKYGVFDVALVDSYDQSKIYAVNANDNENNKVIFTATSDFTPTSWTVININDVTTPITGDHVVISDDLKTLTIDTSGMNAGTYSVMLKGTKAAKITEGQDDPDDELNLTGMLYFQVNR